MLPRLRVVGVSGRAEEQEADDAGDQGSAEDADLRELQVVVVFEGEVRDEQRHREPDAGEASRAGDLFPVGAGGEVADAGFDGDEGAEDDSHGACR